MGTSLLKNITLNGEQQDVLLEDTQIAKISPANSILSDANTRVYDMTGKTLLPGIVDTHVHFRDLGQADKEDWTSASAAAINAGVTTVFDMPNNTPACNSIEAFEQKLEKVKVSKLNAQFYAGVTRNNLQLLRDLLAKYGDRFIGIKLYLAATSNNELFDDEHEFSELFDIAVQYDKPITVHSEDQELINKWSDQTKERSIMTHNTIRNREAAISSTKFLLKLAKTTEAKICIAHTSTKEEVELIRTYKKDRDNVLCEVCTHHLLLNQSHLPAVGNFGKINPPVREKADNEAIWEAIHDGTVDFMGTDHAPHKIAEKQLDFEQAPSGFPGVETFLPLMLNEQAKGTLSLERLVQLLSTKAAEVFKLDLGTIAEGNTATLTVVDLDKKWHIDSAKFHSKAKFSPYHGWEITGKPTHTIIKGEVFELH